jgi:hypothetical protein
MITFARWLAIAATLPLFRIRHRRCTGFATIRTPDLYGLWCAACKRGRAVNPAPLRALTEAALMLAGYAAVEILSSTLGL